MSVRPSPGFAQVNVVIPCAAELPITIRRKQSAYRLSYAQGDILMKSPVTVEKHGNVAVLLVDNPPVNALGAAVRHGLRDAMRQILDDASYSAVVFACGEAYFYRRG
jgi:hypothetical protein